MSRIMESHMITFQSTLSMRRATLVKARTRNFNKISIHALHEESDRTKQYPQT